MPGLDPEKLRRLLLGAAGAVFDGNALDKTTEVARRRAGEARLSLRAGRARTTRDGIARRIDVAFVIDQGPRTYVERIDIHGNTRTRDYVIRREFDIAEGDAYNKTLIDRAERRLKNLNYFKTVKISTKPGSAPDRVVLDVEVVEQATGDFSIAGGYSTTDGLLAEVKVGDSNFMGTGATVKSTFTYGQYARGVDLSAIGALFSSATAFPPASICSPSRPIASSYQSYGSDSYGATLQIGTPLTEQTRRAVALFDLQAERHARSGVAGAPAPSLPIQQAALAGPQWVSAVGDTVTYNTLDNTKSPTNGINSQLRQDLAGLGGDVKFLRTTEDVRYYHALNGDLVGLVRAPGRLHHRLGRPAGAADRQLLRRPDAWCADLRPTASGRAISRPAPPWIMSAAACTGRRRRNCRARSPACRRNTA